MYEKMKFLMIIEILNDFMAVLFYYIWNFNEIFNETTCHILDIGYWGQERK